MAQNWRNVKPPTYFIFLKIFDIIKLMDPTCLSSLIKLKNEKEIKNYQKTIRKFVFNEKNVFIEDSKKTWEY